MAIDQDLNTILSKVGGRSKFTYPGGEAGRQGRLKDRSGLRAPKENGRAPYWATVDLIEYQEEPELMRFATIGDQAASGALRQRWPRGCRCGRSYSLRQGAKRSGFVNCFKT